MRRDSIAGIAGGILLLLLAGPHGAIDSWAAEAKAVPPKAAGAAAAGTGAQAAPPPAKGVYGPYSYQAAGKPDPFRPFIETDPALLKKRQEEQSKKASPQGRPFSPLQQEDLWSFRLVGIAGDQDNAAAIVENKNKKFYPLFVGTYIGLNGGRVASIQPDRVIVEEPSDAPAKKGQKAPPRRVPIMLHKDQ